MTERAVFLFPGNYPLIWTSVGGLIVEDVGFGVNGFKMVLVTDGGVMALDTKSSVKILIMFNGLHGSCILCPLFFF